MNQLNLSITDGFKLRNLLKKKISSLELELRSLLPSYEKMYGDSDSENINRKYGSAFGAMKLLLELQDTLGNLNIAIDQVNVNVRPLLDKIETIKAHISSIDNLMQLISRKKQKVKTHFNTVTGNMDTIEMEQNYSDDDIYCMDDLLRKNRREKNELEEQICSLNGSSKFEFEISEEIFNFVYDL